VGAAAVVDDLFGELLLRRGVASLLVDVVADEIDRRVGAAAGWRKGADGAVAEFAGTKVERQQAVGGGVGEKNFFSHGGEGAAHGGDETGFSDASGEREDGEDRRAGFFLAYGCGFGLVLAILAGLLEHTLEREPARGYAFAGVLQGVGHRGLDGRRLRDEGLWCDLWRGRSVEPCGAWGVGRTR